jgi:hypothetical protein
MLVKLDTGKFYETFSAELEFYLTTTFREDIHEFLYACHISIANYLSERKLRVSKKIHAEELEHAFTSSIFPTSLTLFLDKRKRYRLLFHYFKYF